MRSVPLPFLSKITLLWTRAREPGPVSPVKVDSPLPFPWTQRGEIYILGLRDKNSRLVGWNTVKKKLLEQGFTIKDGREKNRRYSIIQE